MPQYSGYDVKKYRRNERRQVRRGSTSLFTVYRVKIMSLNTMGIFYKVDLMEKRYAFPKLKCQVPFPKYLDRNDIGVFSFI